MNSQYSLTGYVIGVVIALAVVLCIAWFAGGAPRFKTVAAFAIGFLAWMLSMYIKLRIVSRT